MKRHTNRYTPIVRHPANWVLLLGFVLMACGQPESVARSGAPYPIPAALPSMSPAALPSMSPFDSTKVAVDQEIQYGRETLDAQPVPAGRRTSPSVVPTLVDSIKTGISEDCEAPRRFLTIYTNCWLDQIDGEYVNVTAAHDPDDVSQGVVIVYTYTSQLYLTPQRAGAVTVIDAHGPHLTLVAANGTVFGFDAASRTWESPLPTATPSPSGLRAITFEGGRLVDTTTGADLAADGITLERFDPINGRYAARIKAPGAESYLSTAIAATPDLAVGLVLHLTALPTAPTRVLLLIGAASPTDDRGNLVLNPDGTLQLYAGTSPIGGASPPLVPGNTYRIGIQQHSDATQLTIAGYLTDDHTAFGAAFASGAVPGGNQSVTTLKVGAGQAGPINIVVDDIQIDRALLPGP